jgi:hypothetical protein
MNDNIKEKLKQAEKNINEIEFVVKYKGNKLHTSTIPIPHYAQEVFDDEVSFHYLFKKMAAELKDQINEEHKRLFFERQDGSGRLVE